MSSLRDFRFVGRLPAVTLRYTAGYAHLAPCGANINFLLIYYKKIFH
ncbi:MAG: hypothetical protein LBB88_05640 [Planctomycetaceae bacterium]|nr:hypothetical protein [Planctomycetaceae bacterium]